MFCSRCGKEIEDDAFFCHNCGSSTGRVSTNDGQLSSKSPHTQPKDKSSFLLGLLCFFVPILGLILYFAWKDELPLRAKSCGKGALISVTIRVLGSLFVVILVVLLFSIGAFYI